MWKAAGLMFVAMSFVPAGDTAGKLLTAGHGASPFFVAWSRFVLGAALIAALAPRGTLRLFLDWRIWLRGLLLAGGVSSILTALRTEPVADVFAAFFVGPLFSYALSALLGREPVTPLRTALMGLGFLGVLLVVRPGFGAGPGMGFALLAGLFYGAYLSSSRWLAPLAPSRALLVTQLVVGALILTPVGLPAMPEITAPVAALTLASAMASMLGNLLLLTAYARAPATHLAPFVHFQLLAAVVLGWAVFGDLPDAPTWAGLALIVGAGVASARLAAAPLPPRPDRA